MLKSTKVILITAGVLVGLGMIIGGIAMGISRIRYGSVANMYNSANNNKEYTRQTMEIKDQIENLEVSEVSSDINLLPSDKKTVYVEYTDGPNYVNKIEVDGKTLKIRYENNTPWYHKWGRVNIDSFFDGSDNESEPVNVYLPAGVYNEVKLATVSGNINVMNELECDDLSLDSISGEVKAENCKISDGLSVNVTSGEVDLKNIETEELNVNTVSGNITAEAVKPDKTDLNTTSGDITLDGFDCENTDINTTSGDIRAYVIGEYNIYTDTVSGNVETDASSASGHPLNINTTSGDITIRQK